MLPCKNIDIATAEQTASAANLQLPALFGLAQAAGSLSRFPT